MPPMRSAGMGSRRGDTSSTRSRFDGPNEVNRGTGGDRITNNSFLYKEFEQNGSINARSARIENLTINNNAPDSQPSSPRQSRWKAFLEEKSRRGAYSAEQSRRYADTMGRLQEYFFQRQAENLNR